MADTYHSEHADDHDDPDSTSTLVIGILGAIVLFIVIVLLQVVFSDQLEKERYRKQVLQPPAALKQYRAEQEGELNSYGWISQSDGTVRIPIDRAMELVVEEQGKSLP